MEEERQAYQAYFARRLHAEEAELDAQLEAYERERKASLRESVHELSSYDNHPTDLASETFERSKDLALLDNARELRRQVSAALGRLGTGSYGRCVKCGREIDRERLEAIPHADLCLRCQRQTEAFNPPRRRPIEEEALKRAGAQAPADDDGSWQEVARYGSSETPADMGGADPYQERGQLET